ncbi:Hermansky-Pudlak syndrome 1 protein [Ixodes scapularis]
MKGFIIFDSLNDVVYKHLDGDLVKHIVEVCIKNGLLEETSREIEDSSNVVTNDVLVQLFSPLVTSQRVMKERIHTAYSSIYCKDQTLCVFTEFFGCTVLGINSEKEDAEATCRKRLKVFLCLVQRLYGPALDELRYNSANGDKRAVLLGRLIEAYNDLRQSDQMFLFEALERVIVNADIASTCSNLLQEVLETFRRFSPKGEMACHSYLLLNNKLVATYSSRNSTLLSQADLLVLFLTLRVVHEQDGGDTCREPTSGGLHSLLLFFATSLHSAMPFVTHSLRVTESIMLVVVSEVNKVLLADNLFSLMKQMQSIQQNPEEGRCRLTVDVLESAINRLMDTSRRAELKSDQEMSISLVSKKWTYLKMSGFVEYLSGPENAELASRSEEALLLLKKALQAAFEELVLKPEIARETEPRPRLVESLKLVKTLVEKRLEDYMDFLLVKADEDLSISSFSTQYPGLLHFSYINRSSNQMIAPRIASEELRDKVWKGWDFAQKYAHEGSFTTMWAEGELQFSYILWFENLAGKTVKPKCAVDPSSLRRMSYPGAMVGNFYGQLMRYCFPDVSLDQLSCLELVCVHSETVLSGTILDQLHRLSSSLGHLCQPAALS